ncbi:hypothetical protein cyc_01327 [Cyclospora cayetanensis]|uniref:F-box domain-containing protein n=1 Tax=Cyclospora cayetanensis TaxID=88456 RepID=A0A1D3D1C1_9EIME|nr:hypothetical protein cyc_01327 [Cyclospora cayetanensis]
MAGKRVAHGRSLAASQTRPTSLGSIKSVLPLRTPQDESRVCVLETLTAATASLDLRSYRAVARQSDGEGPLGRAQWRSCCLHPSHQIAAPSAGRAAAPVSASCSGAAVAAAPASHDSRSRGLIPSLGSLHTQGLTCLRNGLPGQPLWLQRAQQHPPQQRSRLECASLRSVPPQSLLNSQGDPLRNSATNSQKQRQPQEGRRLNGAAPRSSNSSHPGAALSSTVTASETPLGEALSGWAATSAGASASRVQTPVSLRSVRNKEVSLSPPRKKMNTRASRCQKGGTAFRHLSASAGSTVRAHTQATAAVGLPTTPHHKLRGLPHHTVQHRELGSRIAAAATPPGAAAKVHQRLRRPQLRQQTEGTQEAVCSAEAPQTAAQQWRSRALQLEQQEQAHPQQQQQQQPRAAAARFGWSLCTRLHRQPREQQRQQQRQRHHKRASLPQRLPGRPQKALHQMHETERLRSSLLTGQTGCHRHPNNGSRQKRVTGRDAAFAAPRSQRASKETSKRQHLSRRQPPQIRALPLQQHQPLRHHPRRPPRSPLSQQQQDQLLLQFISRERESEADVQWEGPLVGAGGASGRRHFAWALLPEGVQLLVCSLLDSQTIGALAAAGRAGRAAADHPLCWMLRCTRLLAPCFSATAARTADLPLGAPLKQRLRLRRKWTLRNQQLLCGRAEPARAEAAATIGETALATPPGGRPRAAACKDHVEADSPARLWESTFLRRKSSDSNGSATTSSESGSDERRPVVSQWEAWAAHTLNDEAYGFDYRRLLLDRNGWKPRSGSAPSWRRIKREANPAHVNTMDARQQFGFLYLAGEGIKRQHCPPSAQLQILSLRDLSLQARISLSSRAINCLDLSHEILVCGDDSGVIRFFDPFSLEAKGRHIPAFPSGLLPPNLRASQEVNDLRLCGTEQHVLAVRTASRYPAGLDLLDIQSGVSRAIKPEQTEGHWIHAVDVDQLSMRCPYASRSEGRLARPVVQKIPQTKRMLWPLRVEGHRAFANGVFGQGDFTGRIQQVDMRMPVVRPSEAMAAASLEPWTSVDASVAAPGSLVHLLPNKRVEDIRIFDGQLYALANDARGSLSIVRFNVDNPGDAQSLGTIDCFPAEDWAEPLRLLLVYESKCWQRAALLSVSAAEGWTATYGNYISTGCFRNPLEAPLDNEEPLLLPPLYETTLEQSD